MPRKPRYMTIGRGKGLLLRKVKAGHLNSPLVVLVGVYDKLDWHFNVQILLQFKQMFFPRTATSLKLNNLSTWINLGQEIQRCINQWQKTFL